MENDQTQSASDTFDRIIGTLHGLPDVRSSKPTTIRSVTPMLGRSQTFVIQTYRQKDAGDFIFVELVEGDGRARIVLPPGAAAAIARQREALTAAGRRAHGREVGRRVAAERKARGEPPAFRRRSREENPELRSLLP